MTRSRLVPALVAAAVLLGAVGCKGGNQAVQPIPSAMPAASPAAPTPTSSPSAADVPLSGLPVPSTRQDFEPFTGPPSDLFGADNVMNAYVAATQWALRSAFDPALVNLTDPTAEDLSPPETAMTTELREYWQERAMRVEAGTATPEDEADLTALVSWAIPSLVPGGKPAAPPFRRAGYGGAQTEIVKATVQGVEQDALLMSFPVSGDLLLTHPDGRLLAAPIRRQLSLTLVQTVDPTRPWAVHEYRGSYDLGDPRPV